ncbi:MAG: TonB-dependent receptor [Muribaculaceae bacterium]|nr:TonB-dependent receptor [Muribaculaceae bacterium]
MKHPLLVLSVIAVGAASLSATPLDEDTLHLKEVLVTAPAKTNVMLTPLDVSVVTSTVIEKSTESSLMPVIQHNVPGVFVTERGFAGYGVSNGAAGSMSIRGVGDNNRVLFLIDGQPQWAGLFGHSLPDIYVSNGVERVEVVKGPSSLLYGSGAMAGSVNIITRHHTEDGVSGRARAMFGSFTTQKFDVSTGFKKGKLSGVAAGQVNRSNGNREGSEFWLANEYLHMQYSASGHWNVGTNVEMTQTKSNNPGTLQSPLLSMWTRMDRGMASVFANDRYGIANGGAQAWISWGKHLIDDGYAPGGTPRSYLFNSTDYNMGFTVFQTVNPWQMADISAGIDFQHWGGHSWNTDKADPSQRTSDFHQGENEVAGYVMMQQGFFSDRLSVNAGVRLQHGSQYGNVWVPQAGVIYHPAAAADIKFSYGKGFRSPNLRELYMYGMANSDLRPEYMYNYELAYNQHLLSGRLMLGAALYFIDGKDQILMIPVDGRNRWMNVGKFHNKGFELQGAYTINSLWNIQANYAYLHTDNNSVIAPKNTLNAELNYTPGPLSFTLSSNTVWSLQNGNPTGATASYSLLNLRASYTMGLRMPLTYLVKLDNITNRHYDVIYGRPMPGITIMGGVEFKF